MTEIDYANPGAGRRAAERWARMAPSALRAHVAALGVSVAAVGLLAGIEDLRMHAAIAEGAAIAAELERTQARVPAVEAALRERARLRALAARAVEIRRSGATRAATIATIGDAMPPQAWLSSIRVQPSGYTVEGRAAYLAAVGAAMSSLARLPEIAAARIIDVHAAAGRPGVTYAIALDVRR